MVLISFGPAHAQDEAELGLNVGLYESPPFVMGDPAAPEGMAIELWEMLAEKNG